MTPYDQDRIRDRAYALWDEAGRPEGRDWEFWVAAERELADDEHRDESESAVDPLSVAVIGGLPTH